jgi:hypothetical protein
MLHLRPQYAVVTDIGRKLPPEELLTAPGKGKAAFLIELMAKGEF